MVLKQLEYLTEIMKDLAFVTRDCILLLNKKTEFSNERISRLGKEIVFEKERITELSEGRFANLFV